MKRIYQGRVASVEIPNPVKADAKETPWKPVPGGDEFLWQHHAHFQDGVNYYLVALLALAAPTNKALGRLRQRIATPGDEYQIWGPFRRRGADRGGLRDSVACYLTPGNPTPSLEEAFAAVMAGNTSSAELRDLCVSELLFVCKGDSPIKNQGGWMLSRFCAPRYKGGFPFDDAAAIREQGAARLSTELHEIETQTELESFAAALEPNWVVNLAREAAPLVGSDARERLLKSLDHFRQLFHGKSPGTKLGPRVSDFLREHRSAEQELSILHDEISALPAEKLPAIPANNRSIPDRLEACLLFKFFPKRFTADLLRTSFPRAKTVVVDPAVREEDQFLRFGGDAIELARGARGYVFRAFTSLPCWNPADSPEPQWKEFDIAAFKYALTALNQIEEKTKERETDAGLIRQRLAYMRGETRKFIGTTDQDEPPPVLLGDPRVARLRALLASEKLRTANALTDGDSTDYGLHPRTIRGFRDLRKIWRRHAAAGVAFSPEIHAKLRDDLRDFQTENSETVGSVALFDALLAAENWVVWQEPDSATAMRWAAAGFATETNDPLAALVEERELEEKLLRLAEPIRLTPADPVHSRRQYDFNAVSKFSAGPRARCRHEAEALAFTTEIAVCENGLWRLQAVRLRYTAPRLLRDGLRTDEGKSDLTTAHWLQPMMEALSPAPELPQNLTDYPVSLMPDITVSGERRVLLNFPITLEPAALLHKLGKAKNWEGQFCGPKDSPFALRWPADGWPADREPSAWYHRVTRLTTLGVDLGTRDAGAVAHITVIADTPQKPVHRLLGEAGGHCWFASLTATQLIRLPGEDAKIFRPGEPAPVVEPFGERGRPASPEETASASTLIAELGEDAEKMLGSPTAEHRRFYSLQNDLLLVALRRAQARLARMQSWSVRLREEPECSEATAEIVTVYPERAALSLSDHIAANDAALLAQRDLVSRSLVLIANRVLPLRGRRWIWVANELEHRGHVLRQTDPGTDPTPRQIAGQRGLSHERLEQIEELRRRCQSLSRALAHAPGVRVRIGRSTRGDELPDPCPALLEKIEHLREQRVDQTAHAILAAALGVRLRAPTKDAATRLARDIHGEYERFRDPVDFIVIEDLSRYLSSQDRARRENTRLMQWCHRQLVTKLRQLCETYGIPVLATPAAYSSRFCSRTGMAGFRAVELTPAARHEAPWRWILARLDAHDRGEKHLESETLLEARRVQGLFADLDRLNMGRTDSKKPPHTLLAPLQGGPIFVPIGDAPAMQADLNAATNIALRGLAAPDRHDIHHRIRTERQKGGGLVLRATTKREKARWADDPPALTLTTGAVASERAPNLFIDLARAAEFDRASLSGLEQPFATSRGLWTAVKRRAWERASALNCARIAKWNAVTPVANHPEL